MVIKNSSESRKESQVLSEKAQRCVLFFLQSILLLGLLSCIAQEPRDLRKTKYYAKKKPVGKPQYGTQTQNYFQEGSNTSATRMILQDNLLDGFYMTVQQAIGTGYQNTEAATFLQEFVIEAKASGLISDLIKRHGVAEKLKVAV